MTEEEKLAALKADYCEKLREAEKAAYAYFAACDVGPERFAAHDMYQEIRTMLPRHVVR